MAITERDAGIVIVESTQKVMIMNSNFDTRSEIRGENKPVKSRTMSLHTDGTSRDVSETNKFTRQRAREYTCTCTNKHTNTHIYVCKHSWTHPHAWIRSIFY